MIERKTYIPNRPRNKKLVKSGGGSMSLRSSASGEGMTSEQLTILNNLASWWKIDEDGNLYTELNLYSKLEISAYGKGPGGLVIPPFEITDPVAGQAIQFDGTHWVNVPWPGGGGGGSTVSWGTTLNGYSPLTVEGLAKTVALSGHAHAASDITSGIFATARLGGGTPSASNFLRGDGTWATPAGATYSAGNGLTLSGTVFSLPVTIVGTGNVVEDVLQNSSGITVYKTTLASTIYSGSTSIILSGTSFQRAALTGDVTSPQNSNALTLANSGVTAGTYNNVATQVRPFTVDAKGRVTSIGAAVTITAATLQTARTIWGQPFNGSANVSGDMTGVGSINGSQYQINNSASNPYLRLTSSSYTWYIQVSETTQKMYLGKDGNSGISITQTGLVGINRGTAMPTCALDVIGEIKSSLNVTSPKFSLSTGWTFEPSGTEMQFKYNGVLKHRLLSDGSFVAVGEITAYGAASGGASAFLPLSGGTLTGDLHTPTVSIIGDSNGIRFTKDGSSPYWVWINYENRLGIGNGASAASMMIDNAGNVRMPSFLDVGGEIKSAINVTSPKITLGNGWTIEQTASSFTIRKDGVIKYTINA